MNETGMKRKTAKGHIIFSNMEWFYKEILVTKTPIVFRDHIMASEQNLVKYGTVLFTFHLYCGLMEILVPNTPMFSGVTSRHNLPKYDQT